MKYGNYIPQPTDTSDIELPNELMELGEQIAKNVHEVWSMGRIQEGWSYGPERNDAEKRHPCLVPYEALSEEEKEYDRRTSLSTIKLILKFGFKIVK
ncbi:MAG: Ryanodine receptor Ryr [Prevotella sp.]|nr:Ryanodine receptor Ryr [Prevotella sp.]